MKKSAFVIYGILAILLVPMLACGANVSQVTPTPTKTPRKIKTVAPLETPTPLVIALPTDTPIPTATGTPTPVPPTDTPTAVPPTETPVPPTNTPAPPPPPTNTPVPPPPPTSPPAAATQPPAPPAGSGPVVIINIPGGDEYGLGDKVKFNITVTDPDGIQSFTWGVFAQNVSPVGLGGEKGCGGATQCDLSDQFEAQLPGIFFLGVDALDSQGNTVREVKQIYIG